MSVPCPGCQETTVEGKEMLCMKCKDAGLTLTPDLDRVAKLRADLENFNPMEDCLWRIRQNREMAVYLAAHITMRRENGHTLGALVEQIAKCDRDFAVLTKEWRGIDKHGKEAFSGMPNEQRFGLLAKWLEQAPFEHVRQFMAKAVATFKMRSGESAPAAEKKLRLVPGTPETSGGNGVPVG